jgi:hypothetical protein
MCFLISAAFVGVKLIAASYKKNFESLLARIIWIVAAMASSIYIIGILVSEDKSTRIFLSANAL